MRINTKSFLVIALLVLIYLLISYHKISLFFHHPRFNPDDDFFLFTIDCAVQYKYAKIISEGKKIPTIDYKIQWPEGLKVFSNLTLGMEICSGNLYRIFKYFGLNIKFHIFLIYFISFFSSLTLFPLFFLAKSLWNDNLSALVSALFYSFSVTSFSRTIGNFLNEDFAMPFFSIFIFFCFLIIKEKTLINSTYLKRLFSFSFTSIVGALFLSVWHFSQFIFFLITIFLILEYFISENKTIPVLLFYFAIFNIFGCYIDPVMKEKRFIFSIPMISIYSFLLSIFLSRYVLKALNLRENKELTISFFIIIFILTSIIALFLSKNISEYSHVYNLFIDKVKFFGTKPASPSKISPHARILWTTPFTTPTLKEIFVVLFPIYTLLVFPVVELLKNKMSETENHRARFLLFFAFSSLIIFMMIERLNIFFVFFITLLAGGNINFIKSLLRKSTNYRNKIICGIMIMMIVLCFVYEVRRSLNFYKIFFFTRYYNAEDVVKWVGKNTSKEASFLTDFPLSSIIYTYTDRAICIHPKFEAKDIREKYIKFLYVLFEDEKSFYSACKEWKVDYFIYYILYYYEKSDESFRYLADKVDVDITNSAAYKFNFNTYSKNLFQLVYSNNHYKVFKVIY